MIYERATPEFSIKELYCTACNIALYDGDTVGRISLDLPYFHRRCAAKAAIQYIQLHPTIKRVEIATLMGVSLRAADKYYSALRSNGVLK